MRSPLASFRLVLAAMLFALALMYPAAAPARAGEGKMTVADVLAAWKKRQERTRSLRMEWGGPKTDESASPATAKKMAMLRTYLPREYTTNDARFSLVLDGKKLRRDFQGKTPENAPVGQEVVDTSQMTIYTDSEVICHSPKVFREDGSSRYPVGFLESRKGDYCETRNFHVEPVLLHYRALDAAFTAIEPEKLILKETREVVNGRECLVLEELNQGNKGIRVLYTVDPSQDFAIVRYIEFVSFAPEAPFMTVDVTYRRDDAHGWVPSRWNGAAFARKTREVRESCEYTVTSFAVNPPIDPSVFSYTFPAGTYVLDRHDNSHYIALPNGGKRKITEEEMRAGATYDELLRTESGKAVSGRSRAPLSSPAKGMKKATDSP